MPSTLVCKFVEIACCLSNESTGLFTPNAGQHFRDEQRRRRSQFDRGTRMAEAEELDYDAALHHSFYSS